MSARCVSGPIGSWCVHATATRSAWVETSLTLSPPGDTRWLYDALGNSVCCFTPQGEGRALSIVSHLTIERFPTPLAKLQIADPQTAHADRLFTGRPRGAGAVHRAGYRGFGERAARLAARPPGSPHEPALDFLMRLNRTIHDQFEYLGRDQGAAQQPSHTVRMGSGTCRDFAWLMVEALRRLGYAARFVTGYLYSRPRAACAAPARPPPGARCSCPKLGWTEFDPTNALVESPDLIPVAVTRTPAEAAPIQGSIYGDGGRTELKVHVDVRQLETFPAAA